MLMMKIIFYFALTINVNILAKTIFNFNSLDDLERQEDVDMIDHWSTLSAQALFKPALRPGNKFYLEKLFVQAGVENTTLYQNATKYDFFNDDLLKPSKLEDVFLSLAKFLDNSDSKSKVSKELQSYLLRRLFSSPRHQQSHLTNSLASFLTIHFGRLGLYTFNQRFSYLSLYHGGEEAVSRSEHPRGPAGAEVGPQGGQNHRCQRPLGHRADQSWRQ